MKPDQKKHPLIVDNITNAAINRFGDNLLSVLLYGSSREREDFWDLDILIILKVKKGGNQDLSHIKDIVETFKDHTLDLQLFYSEEITSADKFSLDAHGAFFANVLKHAIPFYGENPFLHLTPSEDIYVITLLNRIQRYLFQARQEYIGTGRHNKDKNPAYHNKHVHRAIFDLMLMFGQCQDHEEAIVLFRKRFPDVLSETDWRYLESSSDDIVDYIEIYEKIYSVALSASRMLIPPSNDRLKRASIDGMIFEYVIPEFYKDAVIVIDGLPRVPELSSFLNLLASWGYAVFFPRLKGTWESNGEFLDHNPTDDITNLAREIREGIPLPGVSVQAERIITLGSSFGGLIALNASLDANVAHSVALSPVHTISAILNVQTLGPFIRDVFPGAYRYAPKHWERLLRDEIMSLDTTTQNKSFNPQKCTIIAGEKDDQITINDIRIKCKDSNITLITLPDGHLSLHKNIQKIGPTLARTLQGFK